MAEFFDWLHDDGVTGTTVETPQTPDELFDLVESARANGRTIRAVGSGHSTSKVAHPRAMLVRAEELAVFGDDTLWRKTDLSHTSPALPANARLVRVRAGMTVKEANALLDGQGLALSNMGSYDAQTLIGAIATGTHGTGLHKRPLCDWVVSIEMVTIDALFSPPRTRHLRIEPRNGITDPTRFRADTQGRGRLELVQDDTLFYGAVVGLGCLGIVTAITIAVEPAFWLEESCELFDYRGLRASLLDRVRSHEWCDAVLFSGRVGGDYPCLVTTRGRVTKGSNEIAHDRSDARIREAKKHTRAETPSTAKWGCAGAPLEIPGICLKTMMRQDADESAQAGYLVRSASHRVLRTSVGDWVEATSSEIAMPIEKTIAAMDRLTGVDMAQGAGHFDTLARQGLHHVSPIGVRFGASSEHALSMHYGRATCTMEAPILRGTVPARWDGTGDQIALYHATAQTILFKYEQLLIAAGFKGRPHWGQRHSVKWPFVLREYPNAQRWWETCYRRFNWLGTFSGPFTSALEIPH
jgi:FAD/FMN-containing dehydrogenase